MNPFWERIGQQPIGDYQEFRNDIWKQFGVTRAVMEIDTCGFSRTTQEMGVIYFLRAVHGLRNTCARIFSDHGVHRWRCRADNLTAEFRTTDQALAAAGAIHGQLEGNPFVLGDGRPFQVSIGIGYGLLLDSGPEEGLYGHEMNLASKLGEDIAEGGETLLTSAALDQITDVSPWVVERRRDVISGVSLTYFALLPALADPPKAGGD